jgi:hypothetical protein
MIERNEVYLVSPVRHVTPSQTAVIQSYKDSLANEIVFNPIEDAPQDDSTGHGIVMAELNFLHQAAQSGNGRVDVLWNAGGTPSEGSRVDVGMAIALALPLNLVTIFNEDEPSGPQVTLNLLKEICNPPSEGKPSAVTRLNGELERIQSSQEVIIDWSMNMDGEEEEWQRLRLGLALGCLAQNPNLKIKMGTLEGFDPPDKKSYPKVIAEIERLQSS